ncbi:MAG TPA: hypothetical protein VEW25_11265 [Allosphingosinicella sp.]|nr:hypothetical protein [Allosphingosinicella sp.]
MHMVGLFVPMAGMLMIVAITALITRLIASSVLNRTIREAMRSDPGSVPLLAERLEARPLWGDYLLGWIFVALAVGLVLLGLTERDDWHRMEILRGAIVPAVVGATVLGYSWFARRGSR